MRMPFKFAHMSDCHLGSWSNHPEMKEMAIRAFEVAIDECLSRKVDFIVIAGDLLDTSLPGIDVLKRAVSKFRECKEAGVQVYMVAGSHDYSPTGKTMLSVFENAGLIVDVAKSEENNGRVALSFTTDEKTGCKIAGIFGKKGSLEVESFSRLDVPDEDGFKIFVFHCGIDEHAGMAGVSAVPVSLLPKDFDYYATGHIHVRRVFDTAVGSVAFPGPLFPTSFDELEHYDSGFYVVECDGKAEAESVPIKMFDTLLIEKDVTGMSPGQVGNLLLDALPESLFNTVLLLRIHGTIKGKPSDIDFKAVSDRAASLGAICTKKNVSKLISEEMQESRVADVTNIDELEKRLVAEHASRMPLLGKENVDQLIISLMNSLKEEKGEDETNAAFEGKIKENAKRILGLS